MSTENTLQVQELTIAPELIARPTFQVASAMSLSVLQKAIVAVAGGGPEFAAANEPLQDGMAYAATDGTSYYRPLLRVAGRPPGMRPGPDVCFLEDDSGEISFQWTLEAVPLTGGPAGAKPLPITITAVRLLAAPAYALDFPAPGIDPVEDAADDQSPFRVHGGMPMLRDTVNELEATINNPAPAARLEVTYTYSYTVQVADDPAPDPGPKGWPPRRPWPAPIEVRDHRHPSFQVPLQASTFQLQTFAQTPASFAASEVSNPAISDALIAAASAEPDVGANPTSAMISRRVSPELRDVLLQENVGVIFARHTRPESRTQTVVRSVPFVFEPSQEENAPIYRALHDTANLTSEWTQLGDVGWLRDSDFPNTVFRLPDAMRLAWDAETAAPRMVPTLYRTDTGDPRVRLLLTLAPWQDPAALVRTRAGVHLPAARIVVGGADSSTLHPGGAFPEALTVLGGTDGVPIGLATGAELVLDVSLEFYKLFCSLVTSSQGLGGEVHVAVGTMPAVGDQPAQPRIAILPMTIRLDRVNDLPCEVSVPPDVPAPHTVTVTNKAGVDVVIGGCAATFLQVDPESVVPVDSYPARCTSAFPVTIPAGGSAELQLELETPSSDLLWNGVLVELLDKRLTTSPDVVLKKVHDMSSASDAGRQLTLSSPVFQADTLPAQWSNLISIEVELTVAGTAGISVVLSKANPTRPVALPSRLGDLVQSAVGGITTVGYRVRNNYVDHQGQFTDPQQQSGLDLVIYPHPPD